MELQETFSDKALGKLTYVITHVEKTFRAVKCQMCGNIFYQKVKIAKHLQKKHKLFFGFILKVSTFQTFYLKSKIETSDRLFQYSHYCLESLRLSALVWTIDQGPECLADPGKAKANAN